MPNAAAASCGSDVRVRLAEARLCFPILRYFLDKFSLLFGLESASRQNFWCFSNFARTGIVMIQLFPIFLLGLFSCVQVLVFRVIPDRRQCPLVPQLRAALVAVATARTAKESFCLSFSFSGFSGRPQCTSHALADRAPNSIFRNSIWNLETKEPNSETGD